MASVQVRADGVDLDSPTLIEGLPGAGLVGKIAADHLVEEFEMTHYADVRCEGLADVAVYEADSRAVLTPVRIYADEERDLLVLQSDVPVSPSSAEAFVGCLSGWVAERDAFPLYLSGLPVEEKSDVPALFGVATGAAGDRVADAGIEPPEQGGLVSGPTGALLARAADEELDSVALVVETEAQFPDPEAARTLLQNGIEPLAGIEVDTEELVERAAEIREAREQLAQRLHEAQDESTQAQPIRGFQ
ncbi:MAG: proteasome assembly chaperone family protein [Haloarculaceae archaeon]